MNPPGIKAFQRSANLIAAQTESRKTTKAFSVAEIVSRIRTLIESQFASPIWIEGELSNLSQPASGHIYFDLVDEQVTDRRGQRLLLPSAFFRNANQHLKFELEDGMKILCFGEIATYEAKGQYQLRVLRVEPKGVGALQLAFEQLKKRLESDGLFDEARKRQIPKLPERVGIVTSRTGSAIHDMIIRLRGHFHVVILPTKVQGEGAAQEIAQAIELANARQIADVLIVGRGGGSIEDLWAFNEEVVARAIFASRIPVISAVGHEDHWTISDYVADLRVSTPTHAAQMLAHDRIFLIDGTHELIRRLTDTMQADLKHCFEELDALSNRLRLLHPIHQLKEYTNRVLEWQAHATRSMQYLLDREDGKLKALAGRLQALSPLAVLARGYSITFTHPIREIVTDPRSVNRGQLLETKVARGRIISAVKETYRESSEENHGTDT